MIFLFVSQTFEIRLKYVYYTFIIRLEYVYFLFFFVVRFLDVFDLEAPFLPAHLLLDVFTLVDETTLTFGRRVRLPLPVCTGLAFETRLVFETRPLVDFAVDDLKLLRATNVGVFC